MTNKEKALNFIKDHPGLNAVGLADALGIKLMSMGSMKLAELENEGRIKWGDGKSGWVYIEQS